LAGSLGSCPTLTDCMFMRSGIPAPFQKTNFVQRLIDRWHKTDTTEWMVKTIDDTTIAIWDVNPRP